MGDGIVSLVVGGMVGSTLELLARRLASVLKNEASLLRGVDKEVNEIRLELEIIRAFLNDADRKKESSELVRTWVKQVRDVAYDVEDIIDEYMFHTTKQQDDEDGFEGRLHSAIRIPSRLYNRRQIATRLRDIKNSILSISDRARRYDLHQIQEGSNSNNAIGARWRHFRESSMFASDEEVVGVEKNRDLLIDWLTDAESCLKLNWVVGMGGLGKTTLVAKVYKSSQVKNHFNYYAWVTVSQSYAIEDLLKRIIAELFQPKENAQANTTSTTDFVQLVEILRSYLQHKRYVVVLDDVWDVDVWNLLRVAFPDCNCGSRILITTRKEDVANVSSLGFQRQVLHLQPLRHEEAWGLFCKKAFWDKPSRDCPPELRASAEAIVDKCEGLPLAIVAIGGLMSLREKTQLAWKNVEDHLSWELSNNPTLERMKSILLLSFYDLPSHLKSCFLYTSVFPEDYQFTQDGLVRIWVAEGFVEERRGMTMEEVGDTYFRELVGRSMLQPSVEEQYWENAIYQVHDLVRDLALSIAKEVKFCSVHDMKEGNQHERHRRLLIYNYNENIQINMTWVRSFLLFGTDVIPSFALYNIFKGFKLLRVLLLENSSIEIIPNEVFELFNLHYLSVRFTKIKELPKSIGRLRNLQTLDVRHSYVKALPKEVEMLKKLRHLYISDDPYQGLDAPPGLCNLEQLQSLQSIEANKEMMKQIEKLSNLRQLSVTNVRKEEGPELCASIQRMKYLRMLVVVASVEDFVLELEASTSPPTCLKTIHIYGRMEKLPLWIGSLENLTNLTLVCSQMKEDPLPLIQGLPNLVSLCLANVYDGQELHFRAGCFLGIKKLSILSFDHLEQIVIEKGSMPSIHSVFIKSCSKLKRIPEGIQYLTSMEILQLVKMPNNFLAMLQEEDKSKIQHIPNIECCHQDGEGNLLFINLK